MKSLVYILSLFVATFSYAANTIEIKENILVNDLKEKNFCIYVENLNQEIFGCSSTRETVITSNPDGTSTTTTIVYVSCSTPEELAQYHKLLSYE